MDLSVEIRDFLERFQHLQVQRHSSDQLIQDLLIYVEAVESKLRTENSSLASRLHDAELDISATIKSRRDLQQHLQLLESQNTALLQEIEIFKNHNPYLIVLIDGDGLLFIEELVRQGVEGGKKAAHLLLSAILAECGEHAASVEVVAKVYANLSGLGKAMRRDGSLDKESDLKDFFVGFTQAKASFDFIDVGPNSKLVSTKIEEMVRWNLRNINCKQAILGISHDAGYTPFLKKLVIDPPTKNRITVLEGFPTVRELVSTDVSIMIRNETLFRASKLVDRGLQGTPPQPVTAGVIGAALTPSVASSSPAASPAPTWARAIGGASPPPQIMLPIQPRPVNTPARAAQAAKPPPWNPGTRGLDPPLQVSQAALDNIKKRKDNNKLCNNHYLRGPCAKGDACCFEHKYKPNKDEITAIAFLTRLNPCENGQECDVENCIYGHHCPSVQNGVCTHPFCKFQIEDHPPGTKFKTKGH